jgi:hypothetical protein
MSKTVQSQDEKRMVESLKSESKREIDKKVRLEDEFKFQASTLANSYSGDPELWSLWYSQILEGIFEGTKDIFLTPIEREDKDIEEALERFCTCIDDLVEKTSKRTDKDTTPLIKSRRKIEAFLSEESDSVTLILEIKGGECKLECINGFISDQIIKFDISESQTCSTDEASLREHSQEVIEFLNSYSPYRRRPQEKYRRTLCVSIASKDNKNVVSVGVDEVRTRSYSITEKLISLIGEDFSSQNYNEFIS